MTGWNIHDEGPNFTFTFPAFTLGAGGKVKLHTAPGANRATDLYWGQNSHVWNNTGTETAYLVDPNGAAVTQKSCRSGPVSTGSGPDPASVDRSRPSAQELTVSP